MQTNEKRLLVVAAILLIIFALTFTFTRMNKDNNDNNQLDDNSNIKTIDSNYSFENVDITDISMLIDGNNSKFSAKITNKASREVSVSKVDAMLIDKDGFVIATYNCLSDIKLSPNDSKIITMDNIPELKDTTNIQFNLE